MVDLEAFPPPIATALQDLSAHYELTETNNRGANGYLVFGINRVTALNVAIKFYCGETGASRHDEPRLLGSVASANVLQIHEARQIADEWAYFITPRCIEGDLDALINTKPSLHKAINVALGICSGVSAIHALGMVHRDLKPANIMMQSGIPKIADFGSVRTLDPATRDVVASRHSILYRPPESFAAGRYTLQGDVYQAGLVTYQLLGGNLSYELLDHLTAKEKSQLSSLGSDYERSRFVDAAIRGKAERGTLINVQSLPDWVDAAFRRFFRRLLCADVTRRPDSIADLAAELTSMRSRVGDWRWNGDHAQCALNGVCTELRQTSQGVFEAFRDSGAGYRRVPRIEAGSLREVLARI